MTEEEKEAIDRLNRIITTKFNNDYSIDNLDKEAIETVLNMLKEKDKEIEHQIEKRNNQKAELAILNEKQKEMNKLTNTVSSYKGMFKKEQKENMIKDKEIEQLKEENEKLNKMIDGINKTNYPIIN